MWTCMHLPCLPVGTYQTIRKWILNIEEFYTTEWFQYYVMFLFPPHDQFQWAILIFIELIWYDGFVIIYYESP